MGLQKILYVLGAAAGKSPELPDALPQSEEEVRRILMLEQKVYLIYIEIGVPALSRVLRYPVDYRVQNYEHTYGHQLFPEIEYWNYEGTVNPEYKPCLAKLAEFESALYRGSRFERIREGAVANELYLAVPAGLIRPDELAEGWGLLSVSNDLSVEVVCEAVHFDCPGEHMLHLSQNIAASSLRDVLFSHGIYQEPDGRISYRRPPRMRPRQTLF